MADINIKTITLNKLTQEQYSGATINPNEFYLITDAPEPLTETVANSLYAPISLNETVSSLQSTINTKANSADVYTKTDADAKFALLSSVNTINTYMPEDVSDSNKLVDANTMSVALEAKADTSSLGTMASKNASDYSTTQEADSLYSPIEKNVTDASSTSIVIENVEPNTVYHYGTIDSLSITAVSVSDLESIIWFTPSENLTGVTIPETLQPINEFNPVTGKLACLSILNGTVVYGSVL